MASLLSSGCRPTGLAVCAEFSPRSISTPQAARRKTRSETESSREPLSHFSPSDPEGGFSCGSLFDRPDLGSVNIIQPSWKIGWSGGGICHNGEFRASSLKTLSSSSRSNFSNSSNSLDVFFSTSVYLPVISYEITFNEPEGEYRLPPQSPLICLVYYTHKCPPVKPGKVKNTDTRARRITLSPSRILLLAKIVIHQSHHVDERPEFPGPIPLRRERGPAPACSTPTPSASRQDRSTSGRCQ